MNISNIKQRCLDSLEFSQQTLFNQSREGEGKCYDGGKRVKNIMTAITSKDSMHSTVCTNYTQDNIKANKGGVCNEAKLKINQEDARWGQCPSPSPSKIKRIKSETSLTPHKQISPINLMKSREVMQKIQERLQKNNIKFNSPVKEDCKKKPRFSEVTPSPSSFYNLSPQTQTHSQFDRVRSKDKLNETAMLHNYSFIQVHTPKKLSTTRLQPQPKLKPKVGDFTIGKLIGQGKYGKVNVVQHKRSRTIYALKTLKKELVLKTKYLSQLRREIKIQSLISHCNVVKLYTFFDDETSIYLLLEYCPDGQIYQLEQSGRIPEQHASLLLRGICSGLNELHSKNIIHRDIKPQNIVISMGMCKICDFGWSVCLDEQSRQTFCGTLLYVAPELLLGKTYGKKVDIWALGILAYQMITGQLPFAILQQKDFQKIINGNVKYPASISPSAKDFISCLLHKDPQHRVDLASMLSHPFINRQQ